MSENGNDVIKTNFKGRKIIHYSLIFCILLIQLVIAAFFYNEYVTKKNLGFINKQLDELNHLDTLTNQSRGDLLQAQQYFQKYIDSKDETHLKSYFTAVDHLSQTLDSINTYQNKNSRFKKVLSGQNLDGNRIKDLQVMVDSSRQILQNTEPIPMVIPDLKPYAYNYDFGKYDIETKTYSDTLVKKGLFGRLKDAFAGKVDVKKDSVVVTMKNAQEEKAAKIKYDIDSIMALVNAYYAKNIKVIKEQATKKVTTTKDNSGRFYATFNNLLIYSNELMALYDDGVKKAKLELERELAAENLKSKDTRDMLVIGLIGLMFIVSVILMYFTRLAFVYERELKEANAEIKEHLNFKNRVLGMLSHEMRSPLKMIDLFLRRIDKKNSDENIKDYLKSISFTNHNLLMQSTQILEYAKNQKVENRLIPSDFDLKTEVDSILTAIQPYIENRNNQLVVNSTIPEGLALRSDNTKMNQVFINILANANKFTENGKITVNLKADEKSDHVVLHTKITDTGSGISQADIERIFEPYYQGVISKDVENIGAGLGLNLCKEIVSLFDGEITAESELGKGTTIAFAMNLKRKV